MKFKIKLNIHNKLEYKNYWVSINLTDKVFCNHHKIDMVGLKYYCI